MKKQNNPGSPKLLITAGAQAAAQGLVRSALLTKLLPVTAAVALVVRFFGRRRGTAIRPVAAVNLPQTEGEHTLNGAASAREGCVKRVASSREGCVKRACRSREARSGGRSAVRRFQARAAACVSQPFTGGPQP